MHINFDIYNTLNEHNQNHYLSLMFLNYFDIHFKILSFSINSPTLPLIMISLSSLFECIICSSSLSLKEIKLIAIVN